MSATFVSTRTGWVLGTAPCASPPCTSIVRTVDGGTTWVGIPAPRASLAGDHPGDIRSLRFADAVDGWAFGPELWTTHDGGDHWSQTSLPGVAAGAPVMALEAAAGNVYAAVLDGTRFRIETSPAASDAWAGSPTTVDVGAGPVPRAQLVLQGSAGWLLEVDRTVVGGARLDRGRWVSWDPPCQESGGPATVAGSSTTELVAVCGEGVWNDAPKAVRAYRSDDGGTTFHPIAAALPLACCPVGVAVRHAADATSGTMLLTVDGGHTWRPLTFQ